MKTAVSQLLNIQYPILQGPMGGGLSTPKLVSEVSNLGGLGGYGAYQLYPHEIKDIVSQIRSKTAKPFNINLWVKDVDDNMNFTDEEFQNLVSHFKPYLDELGLSIPEKPKSIKSKFESQVEVLLQENVPVFSFVFGIPDYAILKEFKNKNAVTIGAATTLEEALALEDAQVDIIVASGFEAGGHRPSFLKSPEDSLTGIFTLVQQIVNKVKTPVVGAGGIVNKKGVDALMKLGASGVQIGTAFLACEESGASEEYRNILFSERAEKTTLTKVFTGRLARGISGEISENLDTIKTLPFPLQTHFMSIIREEAIRQNKPELLTFWAGQSVTEIKYRNAKEVFQSLIE
ncbi:MAG: nitronate monooxygenase [Limnohabitans sp.]|nr:nitronate monooxygenase [Limnohabitans sp.]